MADAAKETFAIKAKVRREVDDTVTDLDKLNLEQIRKVLRDNPDGVNFPRTYGMPDVEKAIKRMIINEYYRIWQATPTKQTAIKNAKAEIAKAEAKLKELA